MTDPRNNKINYVELPAADPQASQAFFESVFGWTFVAYGPDYLAFNDGDFDGGFYRADKSSTVENGSALVILYHDNLESVVPDVVSAGGKILKEIFSFPGGRRFHFACPSGNEFAVWSETGA